MTRFPGVVDLRVSIFMLFFLVLIVTYEPSEGFPNVSWTSFPSVLKVNCTGKMTLELLTFLAGTKHLVS